MSKVHWVIQNNLIHENTFKELQQACKDIDISYEEIQVIPFTDTLPSFEMNENNIYYGSTTLMYKIYRVYKPKGLFFDDEIFTMENYNKQWGEHMLNYDAKITTLGDFCGNIDDAYNLEQLYFIRPDADDKSFAGKVRTKREIKAWAFNLPVVENVDLSLSTKIVVGLPFNIKKEWRNYIVNGKVVTSSLYQKNFKLNKSATDIPEDMIKFVEARIKEYRPHDNFVMDIALCGGDNEYYIIECGCLNSVGFYAADISKIVKAVSTWMIK